MLLHTLAVLDLQFDGILLVLQFSCNHHRKPVGRLKVHLCHTRVFARCGRLFSVSLTVNLGVYGKTSFAIAVLANVAQIPLERKNQMWVPIKPSAILSTSQPLQTKLQQIQQVLLTKM